MRERILAEIRRIAAQDGKAPGRAVFERETGIRPADWLGVYWARWGDALTEAGLAQNEKQAKTPEHAVLAALIGAFRHYERMPTTAELRIYGRQHPGFPSHSTIRQSMGGQAGLADKLRAWTAGQPDFADVRAMLPEVKLESAPAKQSGARSDGSVYLLQSGANFKIGRSDQIERRIKEIRIALPEAARLVHTIATDDPAGIEAYWHRRFSERRMNGEWSD